MKKTLLKIRIRMVLCMFGMIVLSPLKFIGWILDRDYDLLYAGLFSVSMGLIIFFDIQRSANWNFEKVIFGYLVVAVVIGIVLRLLVAALLFACILFLPFVETYDNLHIKVLSYRSIIASLSKEQNKKKSIDSN